MNRSNPSLQSGQAVVTVLFVVVIGMLVTTGAITMLLNAYQSLTNQELGREAYAAAEAGIENGMLRLLRDTSYTGETITFMGGKTAVVTVVQSPDIVMVSMGTVNNVSRKIQVNAHITDMNIIVDTWREIP